jgi:hypothetical protein
VHFSNTGNYPASFADMMNANPKELDVPTGVTNPSATTLVKGTSWTLTMNSPGTAAINYTCPATTVTT